MTAGIGGEGGKCWLGQDGRVKWMVQPHTGLCCMLLPRLHKPVFSRHRMFEGSTCLASQCTHNNSNVTRHLGLHIGVQALTVAAWLLKR